MHGVKGLCFCFSVWVGLSSCQTPARDQDQTPQEQQILDSEKAIVRNDLDNGKPEAALGRMRGLLRERPNDPSLQALMGFLQLALKNPGRAIKSFQAAYKLDPTVAPGLNLSAAYIESGDFKKAEQLLKQLLKDAESQNYMYKERIYENLGLVYEKQNKTTKAEAWLQRALEENPTYFLANIELARIYQRTNRPALALKSYKHSMDYCLICYEPVQALTQIYTKLGKPQEARRILSGYVRIEGVAEADRARAGKLLGTLETASSPRGG